MTRHQDRAAMLMRALAGAPVANAARRAATIRGSKTDGLGRGLAMREGYAQGATTKPTGRSHERHWQGRLLTNCLVRPPLVI